MNWCARAGVRSLLSGFVSLGSFVVDDGGSISVSPGATGRN